jgi:hypothetical protein
MMMQNFYALSDEFNGHMSPYLMINFSTKLNETTTIIPVEMYN